MSSALESVRNNLQIALQLHKMIVSGRLVHAFLFCGGSPKSRKDLADAFASELLEGDIIDFISISKPEDKQTIVVDQIEELLEKLKYRPYGKRYVVVIEDAHLMRPEAQNKFLKSLEEPVSETVYILLSERQSAMLPTIVSRCSSYFLEDAEDDTDPLIGGAAEDLFRLTLEAAPYYKKKAALAAILNAKDGQREMAVSLLEAYSEQLRRGLSRAEGDFSSISSKRMIRALETAQRALRSLKEMHSPAYTLKSLCLII